MLVGSNVRRVAVVGGMRIPFARGHGAYARVGNQDMYTAVLQALVAKFRIAGERLGDVTGGAVLKHSKDFNLASVCCPRGSIRRRPASTCSAPAAPVSTPQSAWR